MTEYSARAPLNTPLLNTPLHARRTALKAAIAGAATASLNLISRATPAYGFSNADLNYSKHANTNVVYRVLRGQPELNTTGAEGDKSAGETAFPGNVPIPSLADGLSAKEEAEVLANLPERHLPMSELLRNAVSAPFLIEIGPLEPLGDLAHARNLNIWFFVHGSWDTMTKLAQEQESTFSAVLESESPDIAKKAHTLSDSDLAERSIGRVIRPTVREFYRHAEINVLDRVLLRFTNRMSLTQAKQSLMAASMLDERFAGSPRFGNTWQEIASTRKRELGPLQPYAGWHQYVKATNLVSQRGVILVETHLWMVQPNAWFNGRDLLSSKIRIGAQSMVRRLRTEIKKAT